MLAEKLLVKYEDKLIEAERQMKIEAEIKVKKAVEEAVEKAVEEAVEKAVEEAVEKEVEEAEIRSQKKILNIAKKLLAKGMTIEEVAETMEIQVDALKSLQFGRVDQTK